MDSRRDFLKKAAMLSSGAGLTGLFPPSIQKAMAIDPAPGSTFMDAEHVVILMQENRSFDHCYGSLRGVRGFNDPRAVKLPNKNSVWLQSNSAGDTYVPFRLNIKDTKATWMGSLPHSWTDQTDARNDGKHNRWLEAKRPGQAAYSKMPLTLGYYNREDLPFYYALADAFTVCDQNFCSSLTGTTPNRNYLFTGATRDVKNTKDPARVRNSELDYGVEAQWATFPECLEDNHISWKIYQNEISVGAGLEGEEDAWLSNFTDNPMEWFTQYNVRFHPAYMHFLPRKIEWLKAEITKQEAAAGEPASVKRLTRLRHELEVSVKDQALYTPAGFDKLSPREKNLHQKAFTTNVNDPHYHTLTSLKYRDEAGEREVKVPKGDVLHQFRHDVKNGMLPTVSWLVAPENFSDHPGAPWYGAWYVSEAMDILTQNPDVWKKTIFILCYDENDGYFDHVPPFVPPHPTRPGSGKMSEGLDAVEEYVTMEQELTRQPASESREGPIGLGYRVPLVIASPWSRGGVVNSQVFDHTSVLQLLEKLLSNKTGKKIEVPNISAWRRAVCGDLTSVFAPYNGEKTSLPTFINKHDLIETIHKAKFKDTPSGFKPLTAAEIAQVNSSPRMASFMPQQEKGKRPSNALPYQLYATGRLDAGKGKFNITMEARQNVFGNNAAGAPFLIYSGDAVPRAYAVKAGGSITDTYDTTAGKNGYQLEVHGPNGFYRSYKGNNSDPLFDLICDYELINKSLTGIIEVKVTNKGGQPYTLTVSDNAYGKPAHTVMVPSAGTVKIRIDPEASFSWYDFSITVSGNDVFRWRFAGRVETGRPGFSDPAMA